jgi:hypothetical protein
MTKFKPIQEQKGLDSLTRTTFNSSVKSNAAALKNNNSSIGELMQHLTENNFLKANTTGNNTNDFEMCSLSPHSTPLMRKRCLICYKLLRTAKGQNLTRYYNIKSRLSELNAGKLSNTNHQSLRNAINGSYNYEDNFIMELNNNNNKNSSSNNSSGDEAHINNHVTTNSIKNAKSIANIGDCTELNENENKIENLVTRKPNESETSTKSARNGPSLRLNNPKVDYKREPTVCDLIKKTIIINNDYNSFSFRNSDYQENSDCEQNDCQHECAHNFNSNPVQSKNSLLRKISASYLDSNNDDYEHTLNSDEQLTANSVLNVGNNGQNDEDYDDDDQLNGANRKEQFTYSSLSPNRYVCVNCMTSMNRAESYMRRARVITSSLKSKFLMSIRLFESNRHLRGPFAKSKLRKAARNTRRINLNSSSTIYKHNKNRNRIDEYSHSGNGGGGGGCVNSNHADRSRFGFIDSEESFQQFPNKTRASKQQERSNIGPNIVPDKISEAIELYNFLKSQSTILTLNCQPAANQEQAAAMAAMAVAGATNVAGTTSNEQEQHSQIVSPSSSTSSINKRKRKSVVSYYYFATCLYIFNCNLMCMFFYFVD